MGTIQGVPERLIFDKINRIFRMHNLVQELQISAEPDKPFPDRLSPLLSYLELFYYPHYLSRRDIPLVKFGIDRHKSDISPYFLPVDQPIT